MHRFNVREPAGAGWSPRPRGSRCLYRSCNCSFRYCLLLPSSTSFFYFLPVPDTFVGHRRYDIQDAVDGATADLCHRLDAGPTPRSLNRPRRSRWCTLVRGVSTEVEAPANEPAVCGIAVGLFARVGQLEALVAGAVAVTMVLPLIVMVLAVPELRLGAVVVTLPLDGEDLRRPWSRRPVLRIPPPVLVMAALNLPSVTFDTAGLEAWQPSIKHAPVADRRPATRQRKRSA